MTQIQGAVTGGPRIILGFEAAAILIASVLGYRWLGGGWAMFALLFLVPDFGMLGYLGGRRIGAALYNFTHTLVLPASVAAMAMATGSIALGQIALIWVAHIGFDRAVGYGLKYASAFGDTHLGIARKAPGSAA